LAPSFFVFECSVVANRALIPAKIIVSLKAIGLNLLVGTAVIEVGNASRSIKVKKQVVLTSVASKLIEAVHAA
jgi:hypothetical protein